MAFLLNILLAFLAGGLADYIARRCGVGSPASVIIGVVVGILVFLANPAASIL